MKECFNCLYELMDLDQIPCRSCDGEKSNWKPKLNHQMADIQELVEEQIKDQEDTVSDLCLACSQCKCLLANYYTKPFTDALARLMWLYGMVEED